MTGHVFRFCPHCAYKYVDRLFPDICEGCGISLKRRKGPQPKKRTPNKRKSNIKSSQRRLKVARLRKRDGDKCWLCKEKIEFDLEGQHPMSWSLDHVLPLSKGGSNRDHNLRLAHRVCNSAREQRFAETLRLR